MILSLVFYSVRIWDNRTWEGPAELWDDGSVLQWRQPSQAWRAGGLLFLLIHTHHISHCSGGERWRGKTHTGYLRMSTGSANWVFWKISVVHLRYVCIPLTFRKSSSEFIGISDLSTLHTNPAPGAGAGPGQGICRNPAFYPSIRWAEGRPCVLGQFSRFALSTCMSRCFAGLWGRGKRLGK